MKHKTVKLMGLLILSVFTAIPLKSQLNIISYNIRLNTPHDGENAWPQRKDNVISLLKFHQADVFCLQEALADQVNDVDIAFPNFSYVGVGRDDGVKAGEFAPVFYNNQRFNEKSSGHFWLSETPSVPALGWDAACIRVCSWVLLEEVETGKLLKVFNTHFDHIGVEARKNAADLIINKIGKDFAEYSVVLCGDFNLAPQSVPIQKLSAALNDSYTISELPPHGSISTWSGFSYDDKPGDRIDYIFVSEGTKVKRYAALTDSRDRKFFSDHLAVFIELEF
jgi:endonuclease/exonuclease/phosphatase family metal-dependent hydrolase